MSTLNSNTALRPDTEAPVETAELLGMQIIALLPALRLHSVSLFDGKGDVQWLNQGALGPDEQGVVEEAIATLTAATTRAHLEASLADGRAALFLAVRTPRAQLAGLVMLLMDSKLLTSGNLAARVLTTSMRSVLQKVAMFLVPPPALGSTGMSSGIRTFSTGTLSLEAELTPDAVAQPTANDAPGTPGDAQALAILESVPDTTAGADSATLRLRELIRLRAGGRTRRYQVVPVAEAQRGDALATLTQFLSWLRTHPQVLQADPVSFTIAVSAQALADPELPSALARLLHDAALEPETIGFELRESACVTQRPLAERFVAQCEASRCFAVIDDFTFHTGALELLRSSAVRLLKVETRLVTAALRDKLAQARVVAIAQAAKVLGTHCAAKYVDSESGRRWLTAVGFDFTQSSVVEPIERLLEPDSA